jgi:putative two-component system response regulator
MRLRDIDSINVGVPRVDADAPVASPNVLVAGDQAAALSELLTGEGCAVTRIHDGWAVLDHVGHGSTDVALLDQALPGLNGLDVCRLMKRDQGTRLVPVILFLSDLGSRDERRRGFEAGVDELISAPVNVGELTVRIRALTRVKRYTDDLEPAASVMMTLAAMVEARDRYTEGHCHRMANYAGALGRRIGLGVKDLEALRRGAFLHDVGMLAVPDTVLLKPAALDPEELALIRSHPVIGESFISNLQSLQPVRSIVRQHHERYDGSGYPDGLRGDEISLSAQIVGLLDIFEALTSPRPYQKTRSHAEALELMRGQTERGWHRRDLVDALAGLIRAA